MAGVAVDAPGVVGGGDGVFLDGEFNSFLSSAEESEDESGNDSSVEVVEEIDRCRGAILALLYWQKVFGAAVGEGVFVETTGLVPSLQESIQYGRV